MNNGAMHHEGAAHHAGMLAAAVLRAIDASAGALRKLRNRIETPAEDEESSRNSARRTRSGNTVAPVAEVPAPQQKTLLHRVLIVLMCLLLGAGAGFLVSYSSLTRMINAREALIEHLQDEVENSKKAEALSLNAKVKYLREIADYRKRLHEAKQEIEDQKERIEDLKAQLAALKPVVQAKPQTGQFGQSGMRAAKDGNPAGSPARTPQKTGNCVTGTANATGKVLECLDKFNRP